MANTRVLIGFIAILWSGSALLASPTEAAEETESVPVEVAESSTRLQLEEALADDEGYASITDDQQQKLVQRVSALADVRDNGTAEDHVSLLESWGGSFPYMPGDTSDIAQLSRGKRLLSNWQGKDHDYGISQRYVEKASVRIASRGAPGEANRRPMRWKLMASGTRITSIEFDDDVRKLASDGTLAVEVRMPIVLNNGLDREEGVLMLWSEKKQNWLPYMRFVRQKKESPGENVSFYLSFF